MVKNASPSSPYFTRFRTSYPGHSPVRLAMPEGEQVRTKQSMRDECDLNKIAARNPQALLVPSPVPPIFGDFTELGDYKANIEKVLAAEDLFMALPAKVRERFNHSPADFLAFATNGENGEELISMGLAVRKEPPAAPEATQPPQKGKKASAPAPEEPES